MNCTPNGEGTLLPDAEAVKTENSTVNLRAQFKAIRQVIATAAVVQRRSPSLDQPEPTAPSDRPNKITLTLRDGFEKFGDTALEELLEQALCVISSSRRPREESSASERRWLVRLSLRAVCEAIIAQGCLPMPLAVDLKHVGDRIFRRKVVCRADLQPSGNVIAFPRLASGGKEEA